MPHTVLLIDDSPTLAKLVEHRLTGEPVRLHYAPDGLAGIEAARKLRPDLILLDVEMPGIDGFETCRRLKLDPDLLSIPIIFLSGSTGTPEKILGLELGAIDFLPKPFDSAELRARVRSALRVRRLSELLTTKARLDPVTGLWTEAFLDARLSAEIILARRTVRPVGLVLCDLDHFRKLNADHGPWFGDSLLATVADRFAGSVRQEDVLCRADNARLAVICPGSTVDGVRQLAARLRDLVASLRFYVHGAELSLTASFGVCGLDPAPAATDLQTSADAPPPAFASAATPSTLRAAATAALEASKTTGRDRVTVADASMYPAAHEDGFVPLHFVDRRTAADPPPRGFALPGRAAPPDPTTQAA